MSPVKRIVEDAVGDEWTYQSCLGHPRFLLQKNAEMDARIYDALADEVISWEIYQARMKEMYRQKEAERKAREEMKEEIVGLEGIPEEYHFAVKLTDHPIIRDSHGTLRYKAKPIMRWLADNVSLNDMAYAHSDGVFDRDSFMQFYRDMGYSLSGFEEIWSTVLDEMEFGKEEEESNEGQ